MFLGTWERSALSGVVDSMTTPAPLLRARAYAGLRGKGQIRLQVKLRLLIS